MIYDYEEVRENIRLQAEWTPRIVESVFLQILNKVDIAELRKVRNVYLTGCGDSRIAGKAMEQVFLEISGLPARSFPALEFARYYAPYAESRSVLLAISYSGKVSRTLEAIRLAQEKRLLAIGISRLDVDSPLSNMANCVLALNTPATKQIIPGCLSYFASLLAVAVFSIYLGEARGNIPSYQAEKLYGTLKKIGSHIPDILESCKAKIEGFLETANPEEVWHFLGSGPNYATAEYGAIKLLESASLPSTFYDIEEWAHTGFFLVKQGTPVVVIAPSGKSFQRFQELLPTIKSLRVNLLVLTSSDTPEIEIDETRVIRIKHTEIDECLTPILFCIPLQWLALRVAERLHTIPFHLDDQKRLLINSEQLYNSLQITSLSELNEL